MRNSYLIILILFFQLTIGNAQRADLRLETDDNKVEIPFEYVNNFIVVEVIFNNLLPLKFIFDTGAEYTLLTKKEITDLFLVNYDKRFEVLGSDMETVLYAYLARGVNMRMNEFSALNRSILVLEEDYFRFEKYAGIEVQGILGADIFSRFVVQIDYKRQKIILHVPNSFKKPGKKYMQIPLDIYQGKPFITLNSTLQNNKNFPAKLLIDTGASLALLLYTKSHPSIEIPETVIESNIAMGLGGYVKGYLGRINNLELGDTDINNIITNFQERTEIQDSIIQSTYNRQGILGNRILDRFDVYIDYFREVAYIKPTRKFKKKFKYDRSGLLLIAGGENLTEYTAYQVVANSPAGEAGLKVGDEILKINGIPAFFFSLDGITKKLQKKPGKTIKLTVLRNGHKLKFEFKLRDLI